MDSDSDSGSDVSHVSATPPRTPNPPPPPSLSLTSASNANRRFSKASSSLAHVRSKPPKSSSRPRVAKRSPSPDAKPSKDESPPPDWTPLPTLPFQIRRASDQIRAISSSESMEMLPAGFFSKSSSFSKFRRSCLNLETSEDDRSLSEPSQQNNVETEIASCSTADWGTKDELFSPANPVKFVRKHPNLIGARVPVPPVKVRKCGGEGNFVKLNMNGRKRKFVKKTSGRNYGQRGSFRPYRRTKTKLKTEDCLETAGLCDEDGLVTETTQQKQKQGNGRAKFDPITIEETISNVRNDPSNDNLVQLLKLVYGYDSFQDGQLEAIKMVLAKKSTMVVLPTGAGKSICYQIPAMILPGITVVVSPLVALMIDQIKQLPPVIQGGFLCSSQRPEEVSEIVRLLIQGTMKVLFVSPERFQNTDFLSIFSGGLVVSLLVVDEAHCISEWSHNFRPSYMRLRASLLRAQLNVNCILAMTATANTATIQAIMTALEIHSDNLILKSTVRTNLQLSVSMSKNRVKDLLMLIKSSPITEVQSIIIYCKFQSETDLISRYLCDNGISAKSYHSGLPAKDRKHIQENFCSNKIKVVIATVAFGMGLDKRDVGAVIHYSMPESLEEYVQEIGRAGRDGRLSYCHLFLDNDTYFKLRSLMHSDGVDEYNINKFLSEVFTDKNLCGKVCSIVKEPASRKFDIKEEVMITILTYLELGEIQYLRLLPQLNVTCILNFHKTSPAMLAEKDTVVAEILKKSETKQGQHVFDMITVVNSIGISATSLSNHLQNLKLKGEVTYEMKDLAYCYTILKIPEDFCSLSAHLRKWLSEIQTSKVRKLDAMFDAVTSAVNSCEKKTHGCFNYQQTPCLEGKICSYFQQGDSYDIPNKMNQSSPFLRADIKVFLQSNSQAKFTPRAVARIMHGIGSPAYPSAIWSRTHFWGRYTHVDFQTVTEAAAVELVNFVRKDAAS
ncbi:ATP-dependent DNA helicase Q-like 5 isoform X2 [Momordica charantia]|uniref:DNA 3'-5' helicase n=1 Tax=Momordica charantia TaxID=3673 RepID=A0A6J1DDG1_MOMCH|nr:ATP-dependent DNA helicase Q-like 5 isoform X2 [Momordica charantia]